MIKLEKTEVVGWEAAIRGMRNPMNSWEKSDSFFCGSTGGETNVCELDDDCNPKCPGYGRGFYVGPNDYDLMMRLAKGGPVHAKYRRQIFVSVDITAPLYWWKEFDTYKVGTTANSCSTMHKIHAKEFTLDDFSHDHLDDDPNDQEVYFSVYCSNSNSDDILMDEFDDIETLGLVIKALNHYRDLYLKTKNKRYWYKMIQLLPSSYNQMRTVTMTYENLYNMYHSRKDHKLDEWRVGFCGWIESLPYSEVITLPGRSREETSFQEDLDFFVNDCTEAQLKALYERVKEKMENDNRN